MTTKLTLSMPFKAWEKIKADEQSFIHWMKTHGVPIEGVTLSAEPGTAAHVKTVSQNLLRALCKEQANMAAFWKCVSRKSIDKPVRDTASARYTTWTLAARMSGDVYKAATIPMKGNQ